MQHLRRHRLGCVDSKQHSKQHPKQPPEQSHPQSKLRFEKQSKHRSKR